MAKHVSFAVSAESTADADTIWKWLADGSTWPSWTPIGRFVLEREGQDGGESIGAIRSFRTGAANSREKLLVLSPGKRLRYSALSGLPFRNHEASVDLEPSATGTTITWREDFDAKTGHGWYLKPFLTYFVTRCAQGLAKHAAPERPTHGPSGGQ